MSKSENDSKDKKEYRAHNKNRSYTLRKMVGFNYEFRGNHLMLRQINEKLVKAVFCVTNQRRRRLFEVSSNVFLRMIEEISGSPFS